MSGLPVFASPRLRRVAAIRSVEFRALRLALKTLNAERRAGESWAPLLPMVAFVLRVIVEWAAYRR